MKVKELHVQDRLAIAVTSMQRCGEKIYLGLTGGANILAEYDTSREELLVHYDVFPWIGQRRYCSKIHNALGALPDGSLVLGEGNHFTWDGIPVTVNYFNHELPESMLQRKRDQGYPEVCYTDFCLENLQGWQRSRTDRGGRILRYYPEERRGEVAAWLPEYLYTQSLIVDSARERGFGHTIPDNHFFFVDFKEKSLRDFGRISDYAHHNMLITPQGLCYGAWLDRADQTLKLFRFNPEDESFAYLNSLILPEIGPKIAGNQGVDEWIVTRSGRIFVGTVAEARLLEFFPATETFQPVAVLGQGGRVTSMSEDEAGTVWITAGYPHMRLFAFAPEDNLIQDYGQVNSTYQRCYFHCGCCCNGRLYLGETDCFSPSLHIIDLEELRHTQKPVLVRA